jgi:hypothetical protein
MDLCKPWACGSMEKGLRRASAAEAIIAVASVMVLPSRKAWDGRDERLGGRARRLICADGFEGGSWQQQRMQVAGRRLQGRRCHSQGCRPLYHGRGRNRRGGQACSRAARAHIRDGTRGAEERRRRLDQRPAEGDGVDTSRGAIGESLLGVRVFLVGLGRCRESVRPALDCDEHGRRSAEAAAMGRAPWTAQRWGREIRGSLAAGGSSGFWDGMGMGVLQS